MQVTGNLLIGNNSVRGTDGEIFAIDAETGDRIETSFGGPTESDSGPSAGIGHARIPALQGNNSAITRRLPPRDRRPDTAVEFEPKVILETGSIVLLAVIAPKNGPGFAETLPVKKFHGVGPATAERTRKYGIETGLDLKSKSLAFLQEHFGKSGPYFYGIARGFDERQVGPDRIRKSGGSGRHIHRGYR